MTRVGYYELYECPNCAEVHTKPVYASISHSMPRDAWFEAADLKTCQKCGEKSQFSEYKLVGSTPNPLGSKFDAKEDPRVIHPKLLD